MQGFMNVRTTSNRKNLKQKNSNQAVTDSLGRVFFGGGCQKVLYLLFSQKNLGWGKAGLTE